MINLINHIIHCFKEKRIEYLCEKYHIEEYSINTDYSIDVNADVELGSLKLKKLPLRFRIVNGNFFCNYNRLTTLKGAPEYVEGVFFCHNNKLTNLQHFPRIIGTNHMFHNNPLPSEIMESMLYERVVYRYQDEYAIWNDDGSFNKPRWNILMKDYRNQSLNLD